MTLSYKKRFIRVASLFVLPAITLFVALGANHSPASAQARIPTGQACVKVLYAHTSAIDESIEISIEADPNDAGAGAAGSIAASAIGTTKHFTETDLAPDPSTTADGTGVYCTETVIYEATYSVTVKSPDTLRLLDPSVTTNFFGAALAPTISGTLKEGDVNNDNTVSIADVGMLIPSYARSLGDSGYNAAADLNEDDTVSIADVGLLIPNYSQSGQREINAPTACGAVALTLSDPDVAAGDSGSLVIGWTGGDVSAFDITLSFDSSFLTLDNASSPATISGFPIPLINTSGAGTLQVAALNFADVPPSTNFISIPFTTNGANAEGSTSSFTVTAFEATCGGATQTVNLSDTGVVSTSAPTAISLSNTSVANNAQSTTVLLLSVTLMAAVSVVSSYAIGASRRQSF